MVSKIVRYGLIGFIILLVVGSLGGPTKQEKENKDQEWANSRKAFCDSLGPSLKIAMESYVERVSSDKREVFVLPSFAQARFADKEAFITAYAKCVAKHDAAVVRDNISGRVVMEYGPFSGVSVPD